MVIFDGPDGSGKSTLINELKERGFPVIKPYYPQKNQLKFYLHSGPIYQGSFLERYYPSEMVYPRFKEGRTQMENYKQFLIEISLKPFHAFIVYVRPPFESIKENINTRGDHYINDNEIEKMVEEYDKFMKRSLLPVITYNYQEDTVPELIHNMRKYLIKNLPPAGVSSGNHAYGVNLMFIGEEPSKTSIGNGFIRPFISDTGSSLFLHDCLYEAGVYDKEMPYFTNFYKYSSHELKAKKANGLLLKNEVERIGPKKIICLGNETYENVRQVISKDFMGKGPKVVKIEHPSYIKRFGGKKEYIEKIRKIIK